jgi:hypothetical protein
MARTIVKENQAYLILFCISLWRTFTYLLRRNMMAKGQKKRNREMKIPKKPKESLVYTS